MLTLCAAFPAFGSNDYSPDTQKVPDAYFRVIGEDLPAVVSETGWSETIDKVREDAKLWLLGSNGQTRVLVVVNFQELKSPGHADTAVAKSESLQAIHRVELIVAASTIDHASKGLESEGSSSDHGPVADVDGPSEAPERSKAVGFIEEDEQFAEEDLLISMVNHLTKLQDLADALPPLWSSLPTATLTRRRQPPHLSLQPVRRQHPRDI